MVKPPKTMEPEAFNINEAGRGAGKAFQKDSFREYMARKIHLQREQFGVVLPPEPSKNEEDELEKKLRKRRKKSTISFALKKLKSRHGSPKRLSQQVKEYGKTKEEEKKILEKDPIEFQSESSHTRDLAKPSASHQQAISTPPQLKRKRPDLFFLGVCALVNGYTNPDADSLQRLLHKHGGNLEKYETSRVTHIIAEHLSTAKANIYKKQRKPIPVVYPKWIVDCVEQKRLLPHGDYLIKEVREENETPSISEYFRTKNPEALDSVTENSVLEISKTCEVPNGMNGSETDVGKPFSNADKVAAQQSNTGNSDSCSINPDVIAPAKDHSLINKDRTEDQKTKSATTFQPMSSSHHPNGQPRTVGNDPNFLDSFFSSSRLSFIGSYRQRIKQSPMKTRNGDEAKREKFVFHVDMDCFFASVAIRNHPHLHDRPVVISHIGKSSGKPSMVAKSLKNSTSECATCNYEARKFGIKKGMSVGRAHELCPDLVVLQYDFEGYEEVSEKVVEIVDSYIEKYGGSIEQVSCDECYAEMYFSGPDIASITIELKEVAERIRKEIFTETSCTASVGVSRNKLLSKLATDKVKPNGSFVVEDYRELLKPLQLRDLHGIGYRLQRKLEEEGLTHIKDVWEMGENADQELCRILGPGMGKKVLNFCYGKDDRDVRPGERQSIGAECNYGVRFDGPYGVDYMIQGLAREVSRRMELVGVLGTKLTLKVKQRQQNAPPPPKFLGHGKCNNLSKGADLPCGATRDEKEFAKQGMRLFENLNVTKDDVRGIGLTVTKLTSDSKQKSNCSDTGISKWLHSGSSSSTNLESPPFSTSATGKEIETTSSEFKLGNECSVQPEPSPTKQCLSKREVFEVDLSDGGNDYSIHNAEDDSDVFIPSTSQIHMSQVDALPSPIRQTIVNGLNARRIQSSPQTCEQKKAPGRQMDLKRMMRHAAVMSGQVELKNAYGEKYSIDQLRELPYEIQLQIANGDEIFFPKRAKASLKNDVSGSSPSSTVRTGAQKSPPPKQSIMNSPAVNLSTVEDPSTPVKIVFEPRRNKTFYEENILPLMTFLDLNDATQEDSLSQVQSFLDQLASERRSHDISVLLRAIWNRRDHWSRPPTFAKLIRQTNRTLLSLHRYTLDVEALFPDFDASNETDSGVSANI